MADKIKPSTPVRATTHPGDTRSNIPTAELEAFARSEEKRPAIVRYPFLRLDPYPGVFVQGVGEYTEAGQAKTVAIAIGPEFGTVGPELIRDTAKEAARFRGLVRARWP